MRPVEIDPKEQGQILQLPLRPLRHGPWPGQIMCDLWRYWNDQERFLRRASVIKLSEDVEPWSVEQLRSRK